MFCRACLGKNSWTTVPAMAPFSSAGSTGMFHVKHATSEFHWSVPCTPTFASSKVPRSPSR
jgi:hypothetical protein